MTFLDFIHLFFEVALVPALLIGVWFAFFSPN